MSHALFDAIENTVAGRLNAMSKQSRKHYSKLYYKDGKLDPEIQNCLKKLIFACSPGLFE